MFNLMKTAILMAAITALFMALGAFIGGRSGMMIALAIALAMNFFSYWFSDKLVLRMYNAREVDEATAPRFVRMVRELAAKAGIADAARVPDRRRRAERIRHRPQSAATPPSLRPPASSACSVRTRTARRDGARAGARQAPRHPHQDDQRDDGRCNLDAGQFRDVLRRPR